MAGLIRMMIGASDTMRTWPDTTTELKSLIRFLIDIPIDYNGTYIPLYYRRIVVDRIDNNSTREDLEYLLMYATMAANEATGMPAATVRQYVQSIVLAAMWKLDH